jgi:mRNA interferase RelE/StbE
MTATPKETKSVSNIEYFGDPIDILHELAANPDNSSLDIDSLMGEAGFRLRVGQYRILYTRQDDRLIIDVIKIRPRGDIYKK